MANCEVTGWKLHLDTFVMRFVREIPDTMLVQKEINNLEQFGFTLVWKADSVEVYAEVADTNLYSRNTRYDEKAA